MHTRALLALALLTALFGAGIVPAQAAPTHAAGPVVAVSTVTAPITCSPEEDACEFGFVPNGGNGYLMFRLSDGRSIWVRASLVPGWNNTQSPPITCRYSTSCVVDFVNQPGNADYWRARQASQPNGPWVQLTKTPTTAAKQTTSTVPDTSGWRFNQGNICVLDQTAGRLPGGLAKPAAKWSESPYLNLVLRTNCAGYPTSQTITVTAFTQYYGDCQTAKVWTTGGYLKPGRVTRADLAINTECNTTALALGLPIGLKLADSNDYGTVMGAAGWPTQRDYLTVASIYAGAGAR